jgi:hypothetical protein
LASANWAICFLSSNVKRLARQLTVCRSEFAWASSKFGDTHDAIALPNATIATPVMTHRIVLIFSSDWALAALNRRFYNAFEKFLPEPCNRRSSDGRRFPAAASVRRSERVTIALSVKTCADRRATPRSGVLSRSAALVRHATREGFSNPAHSVERITQLTDSLKDFHEPQMRHRRLA